MARLAFQSIKNLIQLLIYFLIVFALIHAVMFGIALGEGYLIHWVVPSLELSMAVVIALMINLGTIFSVLGFLRLVSMISDVPNRRQVDDEEEDTDDEEEDTEEANDEEEEEEAEEEDLWDKPPKRSLGKLHFNWDEIVSRRRRKKKR